MNPSMCHPLLCPSAPVMRVEQQAFCSSCSFFNVDSNVQSFNENYFIPCGLNLILSGFGSKQCKNYHTMYTITALSTNAFRNCILEVFGKCCKREFHSAFVKFDLLPYFSLQYYEIILLHQTSNYCKYSPKTFWPSFSMSYPAQQISTAYENLN